MTNPDIMFALRLVVTGAILLIAVVLATPKAHASSWGRSPGSQPVAGGLEAAQLVVVGLCLFIIILFVWLVPVVVVFPSVTAG